DGVNGSHERQLDNIARRFRRVACRPNVYRAFKPSSFPPGRVISRHAYRSLVPANTPSLAHSISRNGRAFHMGCTRLKEGNVLRVQLAPQRAFIGIDIRDAISVTSVLRFRQDYLLQVVQL